MSQNEITRIIK